MRPDGTVVAERLDVDMVGVDTDKIEEARATNVVHWSELTLSPGPFRILVRVSDDRQQLIAARAVDLTLGNDSVRPGLQARER
jgi:hypothetical protein